LEVGLHRRENMRRTLKKIAAVLPERLQQDLKRYYFGRHIRRGVFRADEPDFDCLDSLVSQGDWVIDVGANIGHYTLKLSSLVGSEGRVLAFEPVPRTFELLASNCAMGGYRNVTLMNVAASSAIGIVSMAVPEWPAGVRNFYRAHVSEHGAGENSYQVMAIPIDSLELPRRISFVKIDAEGHELEVVRGMTRLVVRDRPIIIAEGSRATAYLEGLGYSAERLPDSPNTILMCREASPVNA
jgi:FkbM family methyltransferase